MLSVPRGVPSPLLDLTDGFLLANRYAHVQFSTWDRRWWRLKHSVPHVIVGRQVYFRRDELVVWAKKYARRSPPRPDESLGAAALDAVNR